MKNFTGKVTNVDNNGNPIKKKSTGKNGKKSGFKKPASVKKSSFIQLRMFIKLSNKLLRFCNSLAIKNASFLSYSLSMLNAFS